MPAACSLSSGFRRGRHRPRCPAWPRRSRPGARRARRRTADARGSQTPRNTIAAINKSCESSSQPRRRPKQPRQDRHVERVDQRRPKELHRVGRADQRKQPDGAEIDSALAHPDQQRRAGQRERQARREAEKHDDQHAPLQIDRERIGNGMRAGDVGVVIGSVQPKQNPRPLRERVASGERERSG